MKFLFTITFSFLVNFILIAQNDLCDAKVLNEYILKEVNIHRIKVKAPPLYNEPLLSPAGNDHCIYMSTNDELTHFQKSKIKKTPKNRVDFYGEQFAIVGENVQQTWMKIPKKHDIKSCEELAKVLVTGWRNSPKHYANMISKDYSTTFTSVNINSDGKIYACELFGSSAFTISYRDSLLTYKYKPYNEKRCRKCDKKLLVGGLKVINDSIIVYRGLSLDLFQKKFIKRRLRFNRWHYGLAADIVLKEQYQCGKNIVFNGKTGVRGIPLEPVFKKDFRKGKNVFFGRAINIELGKIPNWINQDYEVNLTVINNKRTCMNILYNILPSEFHVDINMQLYLDSIALDYQIDIKDTLNFRLNFTKAGVATEDSLFNPIDLFINKNLGDIQSIIVTGYSSIEGTTESNKKLYISRADLIVQRLLELGVDSSMVTVSYNENFDEFRRDIIGTQYEYLNKNSDEELKNIVNRKLSGELENVLSKHRYAKVSITSSHYEKRQIKKDSIYEMYKQNIVSGNIKNCKKLQSAEYSLAMENSISLDEIRKFKLPISKKYVDLLCDRYLMIYRLDSTNNNRLKIFKDSLEMLRLIDPKNIRVNTNFAILQYPIWMSSLKFKESRRFYDTLMAMKYIDPTIKARIALNYATDLDWWLYSKRVLGKKEYLRNTVKTQIKAAKLNVDETCDLASFYTFFKDFNYAYTLTEKTIYKSKNPDDIVFFLKLIYYLNKSLTSKAVLKHFKRIAQIRGSEFCTYFNSPNINFQILDDPEIREIYCQTCSK